MADANDAAALEAAWAAEQERGAALVDQTDGVRLENVRTVAGVDVEWVAEREGVCVAAVLDFPPPPAAGPPARFFATRHATRAPYRAGFLGYREVDAFLEVVAAASHGLGKSPDCVLVDDNGLLHPRRFGSACQFGLASGLPTVGVAKRLHRCCGAWTEQGVRQAMRDGGLLELDLRDDQGALLGRAVRRSAEAAAPVFVSVGHRLSLDTACAIVRRCLLWKVPEPVRHADVHAGRLARQGFLVG